MTVAAGGGGCGSGLWGFFPGSGAGGFFLRGTGPGGLLGVYRQRQGGKTSLCATSMCKVQLLTGLCSCGGGGGG